MAKIFLTLLFLIYSLVSFGAPTTFVDSKNLNSNLFDFRGFLDWNVVENHLQTSKQKDISVNYYDLEKVRTLYLSKGFEVYEKTEGLYQSRKDVLRSIGSLVPSLHIGISPDNLPQSISGFVSGLLGFLIPSNWFSWLEARQFYHARRYTFLDTMLDKSTLVDILYYNLHLAKSDYEISSFLKRRVNKLVNHFKMEMELYPSDHKIDPFILCLLEVTAVDMNSKVFSFRREALSLLPSLAAEIGLTSYTGHFDIVRLTLQDVGSLPFLDCDEMAAKAKKNSLELRSLDYLVKAAKYTKAAKSSSFLSGAGPGADYRSFGLSFGIDHVASIQIAQSDIKLLGIQRRKTEALIDQIVSSLVFQYNESIQDYRSIVGEKGDYATVFNSIKKSLDAHNLCGEIKTDVHQIDFLFNTLRRMNLLKHNILIYKALIDRYTVTSRLREIMAMLPVTKELDRLKKWAEKRSKKEKANKVPDPF